MFRALELRQWLAPILGIFLAVPFAPAADPLQELRHAVLQAPAVQAARLRWQAAEQRQPAAGQFPDPLIEGMYSEKSTPTEDIPMWEVRLQQPLPKAGERAAERRNADARAAMAGADFYVMTGATAAETAMQLAELTTTRERQALLAAQSARTALAVTAIDARIASGQGASAERLALESLITDQQLMIAREQQMERDTDSALRARLGLAVGNALPPFAAPDVADITIEDAPAVRVAAAREREAAAMATMARASGRPMTAVGLRFEREQMEDGDEDTVGIAFMTEIPWHSRHVARADYAAARHEESASYFQVEIARRDIATQLDAFQRVDALAKTTRDLGARTAARLDAEYEGLLRNASTGGMNADSAVLMLVELLDRQTDVRMKIIDAEGAARVARARLWQHLPPRHLVEPGETP